MKLSVMGLALAAGVLWAICILFVGGAATVLGVKGGAYYGKEFLLTMASIYPGYTGVPGWSDTFIGAGYALVDGLVAGAILACLYNGFARCSSKSD